MKDDKIQDYCRHDVPGWTAWPEVVEATFGPKGHQRACCFVSAEGVQLVASLEVWNGVRVVHASLAPVPSLLPGGTKEEELSRQVLEAAPVVLAAFLGEARVSAPAPDDLRRPQVKHFFTPHLKRIHLPNSGPPGPPGYPGCGATAPAGPAGPARPVTAP